jgi:DNA-binding MarR family transcriptional regulator
LTATLTQTPAQEQAVARLKSFIEDLAHRYITGVDTVRDPSLSRQEFLIIERMAWYNLHTVTDIADKCGLLLSTTSAAVERLVKKGYLERHDDSKDRRVNLLYLVGPGRELLGQLDQMYQSIADAILQQLDPEETSVILRALERITQPNEVLSAEC